jgi:4a-hydroxytetrahydrobiopterin dehydratase
MVIPRLNDAERNSLLAECPAWHLREDGLAISHDFTFADFAAAFAFMTQVAHLAERDDHHPEWSNIYNRVHIVLTTHDADGLSHRDAAMAKAIDQLLAVT